MSQAKSIAKTCEFVLFMSLFLLIVVLVFKSNLDNEMVPKIGECVKAEDGKNVSRGLNSFVQRIYQYYFRPRTAGNFVFSSFSFYEWTSILSLGTEGFSKSELLHALQLPCHLTDPASLIAANFNETVLYHESGCHVTQTFLDVFPKKRFELFDSTRKFQEAMRRDENFEGANLFAKDVISFKSHSDVVRFAFAAKFIIGDEGREPIVDPIVKEAFILRVQSREHEGGCMKVIYLRTNLPNMRLALAFNKDPCDFVLFENDLAQSDLTDVLTPPFTVDDENIDGDDFELYEMTDIILYSNMNLNLPLQGFGVIEVYNRELSHLGPIFGPKPRMALRSVNQETVIRIVKDDFRDHVDTVSETANVNHLCKKTALYFLQDIESQDVVAFGRFSDFPC